VPRVEAITPAVLAMAGGSGSAVGTGGMQTKLEAAGKAAAAGIPTALFSGRDAAAVAALAEGRLRGTLIDAAATRMQARKYWLRHAPAAAGGIRVDEGAVRVVAGGRASLLPGGIVAAWGEFHRGDLVEIAGTAGQVVARGISQYGAGEVSRLAGRHSRDIEQVLGYSYGAEVVHRDDMVSLGETEKAGEVGT